jgi:hypothetical protein
MMRTLANSVSRMSFGLKATKYGVAAVIVAGLIVFSSFYYLGTTVQPTQTSVTGTSTSAGASVSTSTSTSTSTSKSMGIQGQTAQLVIQVTDPPQVPELTSSLNMTYSSLSLLVGEPSGHPGEFNTTTITVTPTNGSGSLQLLRLQNISETLGTVNLPNDSIIYSASFAATSLEIEVNGTASAVVFAGGGSTLTVTISNPYQLSGTNVALLQLNPVVVQTPTGYQLIPSSVGVIRHSEGEGEQQTGSYHSLSQNDAEALDNVYGNLTATMTAFLVSDNVTTITVQVKNIGNGSVVLNAISFQGNFTVVGNCERGGDGVHHDSDGCHSDHPRDVVFVPVNDTVSGAACTSLTMQQPGGEDNDYDRGGLTLGQGQCADLTFTGMISPGESNQTLVPSTLDGQVYTLHVIASDGANLNLTCTLPAGPTSCVTDRHWWD